MGARARRLRVGIAGAGRVYERLYAPALEASPDLEVAAIADPRPVTAGARRFAAVEELLAECGLDGLLILGPPRVHGAQVRAGLEAAVHVLVEKPPAVNLAEMAGWPAERAGLLRAAFTRRGWPSYGRVRRTERGTDWQFTLETNPAAWGAFDAAPPELDLVPHAIDLATWLTCSPIVDVRAERAGERAIEGTFGLAGGQTFRWRVAHGATYREMLAVDGRPRITRPGVLRVPLPWRRSSDVEGVRRVLAAWAGAMRGEDDPDGLLGGPESARRHVEVLEAVVEQVGPGERA